MTEKDFGTLPIHKVFFKLSIPNILSNLFSTIYIIVDGIFVGKYMGANAMASANIVWPVLSILFAISDMIAIGGSVKVSTCLGAGKEDKARKLFSSCLLLIVGIGFCLTLPCIPFLDKIMGFFIKDKELCFLASEYSKVMLWPLPFIMPLFALDNFLKICGKSNYSMVVNVSGSLLNILLDYIFIAKMGLGIEWAAAASVISMLTGAVFSLMPLLSKNLTLYFTKPEISLKELFGIFYNGSSEFFGNTASSMMDIVINSLLLKLGGSLAVASYSIVMYIDSILTGTLYALGDSVQPAISYNEGAGKVDRADRLFHICGFAGAVTSFLCIAGFLLFPRQIASVFTEAGDTALIQMTVTAIMLFAPSYLFKWFNMLSSSFLTAIDKPRESIIIMISNSIIFQVTGLIVLIPVLGVYGIFSTPTFSAFITFLIAFFILKRCREKRREESKIQ